MAITIGREQRDAIYQEVVLDLNGLTDLWMEFDQGNFDRVRELRDRFVLDMRLLDDIGWEPDQDRDEFELTMDGVDLAAVVSYLIGQTGAILRTHIVEPIERTPRRAVGAGPDRVRFDPRPTRARSGDRRATPRPARARQPLIGARSRWEGRGACRSRPPGRGRPAEVERRFAARVRGGAPPPVARGVR